MVEFFEFFLNFLIKEMVIELKSTIEKQEKVVDKLQNDFEDARDKCQSYKLTLETCAK